MSELTKVRTYLEATGASPRNQPIDSLSPVEKTALVEAIINDVWALARSLNIDISPKPLMVVHPAQGPKDLEPTLALEHLSELLHDTFAAYHHLGLGNCASMAFREIHESRMSSLEDTGYFRPDLQSLINVNRVPKFLDQDEDLID